MVQFTLPKNSRPTPGKQWPKPEDGKRLTEFHIYRWSPDEGINPRIDIYWVDRDDCGPMALDALIWIKSKVDPTLTFRRSCREGVCGSCAMNIDGVNTLACTKFHGRNRRRSQDLSAAAPAGDQGSGAGSDALLRPARLIEPWLKTASPTPEKEWRQTPEDRAKLDGLYECILCASCSTVLPELLVERRPLPRPRGAAAGLSLADRFARRGAPVNGSTTSKTRSASTAATRS